MNKNYVGTYGVIKKNRGIDLIYSETEGEGNIFFSILKCIEENDNYLKVVVIGKSKENTPKIAIIKKNGGIDLICSVNYEGGGLFASILKCIDENDEYLKVIIFGNCKKEDEKIAIIKK